MSKVDTKRLIGEVAKRHGLLLDEDDPVLLTATLCEFILDEYVQQLNVNLERAFAREIDRARETAETVVARVGAGIADQVREAGAAVAADFFRSIGARSELVGIGAVAPSPRRWTLPWIAASVVATTAFLLGVAVAGFVGR